MIDWPAMVRQYHALGLWHATRYLATVGTVGDPATLAEDVVQQTWLRLWQEGRFSKALFVTAVMGKAVDAARSTRPISLRPRSGRTKSWGKPREKVTSTFPVQVFGTFISEIVMDEETDLSECGGRLR